MRAGAMKYRLQLLRPVSLSNEFGEERNDYVAQRTVWAERVKMSGQRSEEVGELFADYRVEFNVRDAHPVAEGWRVQQLGGYLYDVTAIIPNLDRGMKTLVCVRHNL